MAISYRGGKSAGTPGQGGGSIAIDSGLTGGSGAAALAGDLVVVTVCVGSAARTPTIAISTPTGYTPLTVQRTSLTSFDTNVQTCYKIMGGTPDTTVTIPPSGNNADGIAYAIQVFESVDATTPMDVAATYATGTGVNNRPDPAAIEPVTAGAWIVCCGGGAASAGGTLTASQLTDVMSANGSDTNDGTVCVGYYTAWTSGSFDPNVFGGGSVSANNSWGCSTLALRPAVVTVSHDSTGTPTGAGGVVTGTAAHIAVHTSTGALSGSGAVAAGTAAHSAAHASTGVLAAPGAEVVGAASSATTRTATGALTGSGATLAGTASSATTRTATGVLVGAGATLAGTASSATTRTATGTLIGAGATVDGAANRVGGVVSHDTDGVLVGTGAVLDGAASSKTTRSAVGALVGAGSIVVGAASSATTRTAIGGLVGTAAFVTGAASRTGAAVTHDTDGALVGAGAFLSGSASIGGGVDEYMNGLVYSPSAGIVRPIPHIFFPTNMDY